MSKCAILFDDDKQKCQTLLHSKKMEVCIHPDCLTYPLLCCSDCIIQLHHHNGDQMAIEKTQFVNQTNKKYQNIQEQLYTYEGESQNFERKGSNLKKLFNGDIERLRIQIIKIIDSFKEQVNQIIDSSLSFNKKQVKIKSEKIREILNQFKPINIGQIQNESLKRLINVIWNTEYQLQIDNMKEFFPILQQEIRGQISQINDSISQELIEQSRNLIEQIAQSVQNYKENKSSLDTTVSEDENSLLKKLKLTRDSLKQQMEQHLASKNCTHKGCHKVESVKAYYGYYYHISGYAVFGELPISVCAKSKKLAQQMDKIVNDLYKLQYRDSHIDDCVQAYFIY